MKKIRNAAYELSLPSHSRFHLVFHVSQLKRVIGQHTGTELPAEVNSDMEMQATPAAVLQWRYNKGGTLEVLIQWTSLPKSEATREEASLVDHCYPTFHLEDKVKL